VGCSDPGTGATEGGPTGNPGSDRTGRQLTTDRPVKRS